MRINTKVLRVVGRRREPVWAALGVSVRAAQVFEEAQPVRGFAFGDHIRFATRRTAGLYGSVANHQGKVRM